MNELHLFSGAGGGILGGILLGHTCVCAVEIEPYCRKVLLQRQRDGCLPKFPIWDDARTFDGKPWRRKVDIVAGGFPCQNISPSGDLTGITEGNKSGLWREMARVVREVEPAFVLVENSAMLTIRGLGIVLGDLAKMGFDAKWGVLGACDAIWLDGAPIFDHERFRCFVKASHPDRIRKLQSKGRIENKWGRIGNCSAESAADSAEQGLEGQRHYPGQSEIAELGNHSSTPANSHSVGQQSEATAKEFQIYSQRDTSPFDSARGRIAMPIVPANNGWWADEPGVGRMVHGMANRTDRIKAIGNGQVPKVVELAWEVLS